MMSSGAADAVGAGPLTIKAAPSPSTVDRTISTRRM
jgi:hypothetical protein